MQTDRQPATHCVRVCHSFYPAMMGGPNCDHDEVETYDLVALSPGDALKWRGEGGRWKPLVFVGAVLDVGIFASDAFAQALGEHLIVFSVDELVFQRRRASVDDENFHEVPPCRTILESRRSGVHRSAAQNVHMDVMYRLLGVVAGIDDNTIAGFIDALDFLTHGNDGSSGFFFIGICLSPDGYGKLFLI